ncbi:hypothetical protein [Microbacterium sp. 18062]|uniref:hypothetical protein n=1 Tax=Microbacterium sp. 18062 TaxID=2681410 RepID=UPI00135A7B36|nr:hypothetical protein [Microbacterium sp. 18062]
MTDDQTPQNSDEELDGRFEDDDVVETDVTAPPQYGVGPFSIREIVLLGIWALGFLFSFFSLTPGAFQSVWTAGLLWVLTIGTPTVAVFLIVLRRLSPTGIRRVGSLGIDQFASVAFSVSAVLWLQYVWDIVAFGAARGVWVPGWVQWVQLVLMTAGVVFTVFAPFIPTIGDDFDYRDETIAHRNARPLRPVVARPAPEPAVHAPQDATGAHPQTVYPVADQTATVDPTAVPAAEPANTTAAYDTGEFTPLGDAFSSSPVVDDASDPDPVAVPAQQPFWALAPVEREVLDETGATLFVIGPTAWALVIEDRGEVFVVRHEDGRIGYLHDVSDVTRG